MWSANRSKTKKIRREKMAGRAIVGSQKEMTAVINNLKESRVLEKAVQTLSLEESYSTKLLELDSKIIRHQYSRLKSNVSKIRSYLTCEEIAAMKALELEGKFKPEHPTISSSSGSKIAAAARRLKLNSYRRHRAVSAMPRLEHQNNCTKSISSSSRQTINGDLLSRSTTPAAEPSTPGGPVCSRAKSTTVSRLSEKRPSTEEILEKITAVQRARKTRSRQTLYTCHDSAENIAGSGETVGRVGDDVFGPDPYEVRRRSLLEAEHRTLRRLNLDKQNFLSSTRLFISNNASIYELKPEQDTEKVIMSIDSMAKRSSGNEKARVHNAKSILGRVDSHLVKQFTEVRKTRYLRLQDDMLDNTGVSTLAIDQCGRAELWRDIANKTRVSFKTAVAL